MKTRLTGVILLSMVSGLAAVVLRWLVNPWFMDQPQTYAFFTLVPLLPLGWWLGPWLPRLARPALWAIFSVGLFGLALVPPLGAKLPAKLVVIGIDGATWSVADKTSMPHLEELVSTGQRGTLLAAEPLFSPLLWTTLATGQPPEVHGIQGLKVQATQSKAARFWEIARDAGVSVGLYKWLVTWPPPADAVSGFTVPAWLAADASTHPSSLSWVKELELSRRVKRKQVPATRSTLAMVLSGIPDGLRWSTLWAGLRFSLMERLSPLPERKRDAFLRRLRLRIDRDVFIAQLHEHRPEVATFTVYLTDALSHTHWSRDGGRYVESAYSLADDVLGEIREQFGPETSLIVLSDHGFRNAGEEVGSHAAVPKIPALETWLEQYVGEVDVVRVGRKLVVTPDVPVDDDVLQRTMSLLTLDSGDPLFRVEVFPRKIAWSLSIEHLPPLASWADTQIAGLALTALVREGRTEEGEHAPEGIVVLSSPGLTPGDLGTVSQLDLMPTMLALMGLPVADDLPGSSWVEESVPRVPTHAHLAPGSGSQGEVTNTERLRELGYID